MARAGDTLVEVRERAVFLDILPSVDAAQRGVVRMVDARPRRCGDALLADLTTAWKTIVAGSPKVVS